jgi:drug/metabolite transporter (DMT)-like permease
MPAASVPPTSAASGRGTALAALIIGAVGFALTPNIVRLSELGPIATGFWRSLFALPLLLALSRIEQGRDPVPPSALRRRDYGWLAFASLAMVADLILFPSSVHYTSIANASLLGGLNPIIVTIGAALLFGERITPLFVAGMAMALVGTALLVEAGPEALAGFNAGDALALASAFSFAFYTLGLKQLRGRLKTGTVVVWNMGIAALCLLPAAAIAGETLWPQSATGWATLVGFAVAVDLVARSAYTFSFARLPASFNAVGLLSFPVIAALIAWVLFGEALSWQQGAAAVIVLAGIGIAQRTTR